MKETEKIKMSHKFQIIDNENIKCDECKSIIKVEVKKEEDYLKQIHHLTNVHSLLCPSYKGLKIAECKFPKQK